MNRALRARALRWGVSPGFVDFTKQWRPAPEASVERVLEIMGAADGAEPPPTGARIVTQGKRVRMGPGEVSTEQGQLVRVNSYLPANLPLGYHRWRSDEGAERSLIVAPAACHLPKQTHMWGWALQLYSLRSERSWGMGDLRDLRDLLEWSHARGATTTMINPLHAPNPGPHPEPSPYYPGSRVFRNPLYLAVEEVPGATEAVPELASLAEQGRKLNASESIDRSAVQAVKIAALGKVWARGIDDPRFDDYVAERGDLLRDYATYVAIAEELGSDWHEWPWELTLRDSPAVARYLQQHGDAVRFHMWLQWLLDEQVKAASRDVAVINDVAVGVDPAGADAWLWQDVFATGVSAGAPPDAFNRSGQTWGALAFDPWKLRAQDYRPFIEIVRAGMRGSGGIRIDHVMSLWRLFWVLDGGDPFDGVYVGYPSSDLLDILALESYRAAAFVVGEDLGTVQEGVRDEMAARRMLSYRVMWFEDEPPSTYPELAFAAVDNHDLPTITGVWTGADVARMKELGMDPNEESEAKVRERAKRLAGVTDDATVDEVSEALYTALAAAPSRIIALTLEDALGVRFRPNYPGTMAPSNWSVPLPSTLEEITTDDRVAHLVEVVGSRR